MTESRWRNWSKGTVERRGFKHFVTEADTGNPTGSGMISPAERARQLGYQSDGSGGYIDPKTGQLAAKTVNGELVFYDNRGNSGGVIADGSGGEQLANAQPSWRDPQTGLITVPPAKPETPEEEATVPDPTPATSPAGYNAFVKKRKEMAYSEPQEMQPEVEPGMGAQQEAEMAVAEDYEPDTLAQRVAQKAPEVRTEPQPETPQRPQLSLAQRMASAVNKNVPKEHRLDDDGDLDIDDAINQKQKGIPLTPNQEATLTHRRDVVRKNPKIESGPNLSNASKSDVAKVLSATPPEEEVERDVTDTPPVQDSMINSTGQRVGRRADHIWDSGVHLTELPGESASMQAIHMLLQDKDLQGISDSLGIKPGSKDWKKLPKETQDKLQGFYNEINEVLPTGYMNSGWDLSSAKQARMAFQDLKEQFGDEEIPQMNIMKPYEATLDEAMRLTNIPKENWDDTYDKMFGMFRDKIGGESQLKRAIDAGKRNVRDVYDPTDINLSRADKHDEIIQGWQDLLDQFEVASEDGLSDEEIKSLTRSFNDYKKKLIETGDMRNISLKQIAANQPGTLKRMGDSADAPEFGFDSDNFGIDFGFGKRGVRASRGGEATDVLDFNNQGINLPFTIGGKRMNVPIIPHPGAGPAKHNPWGSAGSTKSEPQLQGGGAKMGAIPVTQWFDESLNSYSPGLLDRVGGLHQNLGVDEKAKLTGFSDDDVAYWKDQLQQAQAHEGQYSLKDPKFNFMGEDTDFDGYMGGLRELDDMIQGGLDKTDDFGDDEGLNDDQLNDAMFKGLSREARDKIKERFGNVPFSQVRQKMRTKIRGLRYLRLMQELEKEGPDALNRFIQDRIYNPANKIEDLGSPYYKAS